MRRLLILIGLMMFVWMVSAQSDVMSKAVKRRRINHIDFYHVSVGANFAMNRNYCVGLQLSAGVGSFRNVLNADIGLRYQFLGMFIRKREERVSLQQLPLFISLNVNVYRWHTGSLYIGGEMAYIFKVSGRHVLPDANGATHDLKIGKNHFTPAAKIGCRVADCDVSVFYEYDMKPSFDQKYIYETEEFDYGVLRTSIFERMRMGVRFLYHFNF